MTNHSHENAADSDISMAIEPVDFESEAYREMIARSLLSKGNNKRLKAAIDKARRGEEVTIAYIGGSITQGACADPVHTACYAYRSYSIFKEMFGHDGGDNIRYVKAGLGGTPSELGMIRYDRDVRKDGAVQPDVLIVEFAVNDADDETEGICYESLVLKALAANHSPAVILLFSVFINDWNLQDRLSPVGRHYDLPMVSVKDAVVEQFSKTRDDGNVIAKRQFYYDIYHPTNDGHAIMADCLGWLFAETDRSEPNHTDINIDKLPIIGNDFVHIRLLDRLNSHNIASISEGGFAATDTELQLAEMDDHPYGTPQFPNNWMHTAESRHESLTMTLRSRSLILVYKDSGRDDFGTVDIRIDGELVKTVDPQVIKWTHCHAVILYNEREAQERRIEIGMSVGQEHKLFTILGFGIVD